MPKSKPKAKSSKKGKFVFFRKKNRAVREMQKGKS